ncbi:hypothetical protein Goshw_020736 [Gossypium schwendimanii]|uniref:Uncharacterized protein n=1 Tax=Gossypium schwendimanii TaxID=34291 RepID=A0A7J9MJC9_GOSSC|nr:hypothetical protein [Gossypium schwendimanii]
MKSTKEREWEQNKEDLFKLDEGIAKELFSKNSKAWTKAFQGLHSVSDIVDNNLCEAFNFCIMESRFKSIITMLEEIRIEGTKSGRPKKNRRKAKNEPKKMKSGQLSRASLIMRYRKCGVRELEIHKRTTSCIQPNTTGSQVSRKPVSGPASRAIPTSEKFW